MPKCTIMRTCKHSEIIVIRGPKKEHASRRSDAMKKQCTHCSEKAELAAMEKFEKKIKLPVLDGASVMLRYKRYVLLDGVDSTSKKIRKRLRDGSCGSVGDAMLKLAAASVACADPVFWQEANGGWEPCINPGFRNFDMWIKDGVIYNNGNWQLVGDYFDHIFSGQQIDTEQQLADLILAACPA